MIPNYSAVVRTFNSERTLHKTLLSLRIQTPRPLETIIVDSGSTDKTLQIAKKFGCRVVLYPKNQSFNYSHSLNLGIRECSTENVLILSSHCILLYRDIAKTMQLAADTIKAAAVYCQFTTPTRTKNTSSPIRCSLITTIYSDNFDGYNGLWNSCSLIKFKYWRKHNFDLTLPAAEDQEWAVWHYKHSQVPTVCIRNAGVLYLNPYQNSRKEIRDRVVIASRIFPKLRSSRSIFLLFVEALIAALQGKLAQSAKHIRMATYLTYSHFKEPQFASKYFWLRPRIIVTIDRLRINKTMISLPCQKYRRSASPG